MYHLFLSLLINSFDFLVLSVDLKKNIIYLSKILLDRRKRFVVAAPVMSEAMQALQAESKKSGPKSTRTRESKDTVEKQQSGTQSLPAAPTHNSNSNTADSDSG